MLNYRVHTGEEIRDILSEVARLRIIVFREWPYLYDGDAEYEEQYLAGYSASDTSLVVTARHEGRIVGAATGLRMDHADSDYSNAFALAGLPADQTFYMAESVLLPEYRGQGAGHSFFALRERHALSQGLRRAVFCAVIRPEDHPRRPPGARSLEPFWRGRGYQPLPCVIAHFSWKDLDEDSESPKPLQFWSRDLEATT